MLTNKAPIRDNFELTTALGRPIRIRKAVVSANSVTLHPALRLNLRRIYHLTVVGTIGTMVNSAGKVSTTLGVIVDTSGRLLDGADDGVLGSNYYAVISRQILATTQSTKSKSESIKARN